MGYGELTAVFSEGRVTARGFYEMRQQHVSPEHVSRGLSVWYASFLTRVLFGGGRETVSCGGCGLGLLGWLWVRGSLYGSGGREYGVWVVRGTWWAREVLYGSGRSRVECCQTSISGSHLVGSMN